MNPCVRCTCVHREGGVEANEVNKKEDNNRKQRNREMRNRKEESKNIGKEERKRYIDSK